MSPEIVKAMQGKSVNKARKWWHKNSYKVLRVMLFPLWIGGLLKNKINKRLNSKEKWSEERANKILNYYVPRRAEWDTKNKYFEFFDNGMGWSLCFAKKYLKRKDRRFWKVHCEWWGGKMRTFLIDKFELEGFTKEVGACDDGWTTIDFVLNTKGD